MYPLKIQEKYEAVNLHKLSHRFTTAYLWNYISWDFREYVGSHVWVDIVPVQPWQEVFSVLDWVVFKCWEDWAYGKFIFIENKNVPHPDDFNLKTTLFSCYLHLSEVNVVVWQSLKEWDVIWKTWNSWNSFWEHLHFQIDKQEAPFHAYWPYTWVEAKNAGLSFIEWVNKALWYDKAKMYTVNPLVYLDKVSDFKNNLPIKNDLVQPIDNKIAKETIINNSNSTTVVKETITNNSSNTVTRETIITWNNDVVSIDNWSDFFFKDIEKDKYWIYLMDLVKKWFVKWFWDEFKPNNSITRWEFLKLILLIKWVNISTETKTYFEDVLENSWQNKYINIWVNIWIISTKNKQFLPSWTISRVEALKMALILFVWDINNVYSWWFIDVSPNDWFSKYVEYSRINSLISFDKYFYPSKELTRMEVIKILFALKKD